MNKVILFLLQHGLVTWLILLPLSTNAQVQVTNLSSSNQVVRLDWIGGTGPYTVEVSHDLTRWSTQGDPISTRGQNLSAFDDTRFYRIRDLNAADTLGNPFGLLQTQQSEFGTLLGLHRLKTRLWFFRSKGAPHTSPSYAPGTYWRKLFVIYQFLEDGIVHTQVTELEKLGAVSTVGQQLKITWARGEAEAKRNFTLTLDFPYPLATTRTAAPKLSDPRYKLTCDYASPQPELNLIDPPTTTRKDQVDLIELGPPLPNMSFLTRQFSVKQGALEARFHFRDGQPLVEGNPPFILKTYPFDRWLSPSTIEGASLPSISTDSYFSRTIMPGHHNFYAEILIEPGLDPAISQATLESLRAANIRAIYAFRDLAGVVFNGDKEVIRLVDSNFRARRP